MKLSKLLSLLLLFALPLFGQMSPESNSLSTDMDGAQAFNESIRSLKGELRSYFKKAGEIFREEGSESEYKKLLAEVRALKDKIRSLEEEWRKTSVDETASSDDAYSLWDVGETTLPQLVMEYGSSDYLYIIPAELSGMKMSLYSSIPLPRESWNEMVEMILAQNGVGIKKLNPFAKQLYILKLDPSAIEGIVSREEDLDLFYSYSRLFYVFSPPPEQVKAMQSFFERFSDPKQTIVQSIGSKLVFVSSRETIGKLLGLYHAVWEQNKGKVVRLVNLTKINAVEAEKVLKAVFSDTSNKARPTFYPGGGDELATLALPQGLLLIGESETVERGEKILADLECQLEDPGEKVIYWYTCKHSNPEDIAQVLEKVYDSLIGCSFEKKRNGSGPSPDSKSRGSSSASYSIIAGSK